eukprot:TRINITY_DN5445_c0_g1_i2.p1 TRINITY_DN5445_c0_g1~~TRINITY_DN5445_c0_g1_i2.p1  ORF type:complete len:701 (+),score=138.65 TRINITY_DN5445_c0_g1_i2:295-2397(+)
MDLDYASAPLHAFCVDCCALVPTAVQLVCRQHATHQSVRPQHPPRSWRDLSKPFRGLCFTCDALGPSSDAAADSTLTRTASKRSLSFGFPSPFKSSASQQLQQRELVAQLLCSLCKRVLGTHDIIEKMCKEQLKSRRSSRSSHRPSSTDDVSSILPEPITPGISDDNAQKLQRLQDIYGTNFTVDIIQRVLERCKYDEFTASGQLLEMTETNQLKLTPRRDAAVVEEEFVQKKVQEWRSEAAQWVLCVGYDGNPYYVNRIHGDTVWEIPAAIREVAKPSTEWNDVKASDGRIYFVHKVTSETTWEKPIVLDEELAMTSAKELYQAEFSQTASSISNQADAALTASPSAANVNKKRFEVFMELFESERKYIDYLSIMCEVFFEPLKRSILDGTLDSILFSPLEKLLENVNSTLKPLNERIFAYFQTALSEWDESKAVSAIFTKIAPLLKLYSTYVVNYPVALRAVSELGNVEAFRVLLENAVHNSRCEGKTLSSFLIMPIQRVPRYQLFAKSLLDVTPKSHADYPELRKGFSNIESIVQFLNESRRGHEGRERVLSMQEHFMKTADKQLKSFDMVAPGRYLVLEGKVTQKGEMRGYRLRYLFLFNDIIVIAKQISETPVEIHYKDMIFIADIVNTTEGVHEDKEFTILRKSNHRYGIPASSITLSAVDAGDRGRWMHVSVSRFHPSLFCHHDSISTSLLNT